MIKESVTAANVTTRIVHCKSIATVPDQEISLSLVWIFPRILDKPITGHLAGKRVILTNHNSWLIRAIAKTKKYQQNELETLDTLETLERIWEFERFLKWLKSGWSVWIHFQLSFGLYWWL